MPIHPNAKSLRSAVDELRDKRVVQILYMNVRFVPIGIESKNKEIVSRQIRVDFFSFLLDSCACDSSKGNSIGILFGFCKNLSKPQVSHLIIEIVNKEITGISFSLNRLSNR